MPVTERLFTSAEIYFVNATGRNVDVYINYLAEPTVSDPKPLVLSPTSDDLDPPVFVVKDDYATPYGVYTFSIRLRGDIGGQVLAEASIDLQRTHSYTAVFHELDPGEFQLSIYENDLTDGALARLTVVHAAQPMEITWEIRPNEEDPRIPPDERGGSLQRSEWQTATNIVDNDYVIEFFVDGQLVARNPDLDLAREKIFVVIVYGDPAPASNDQLLLRPMTYLEFEFDPGDPEPIEISAPALPLSMSDDNAPVEFMCQPIEIWQTNEATTTVTAVDPDGIVRNLSIDRVEPSLGGVDILGGAFHPSLAIGHPASAEITLKADIPHGIFTIVIGANRGTLAHQATCSFEVSVKPITIDRLRSVVDGYRQSGDIELDMADALMALLDGAEQHLAEGSTEQACQYLKDVLTLIGAEKGKAVSDIAHDHIERETKALRTDLGCG